MRIAEAGADLEAYAAVWNAITPLEPLDLERQREKRAREAHRLYLVAELDGAVAGCGFAGPSQTEGRGFLAPRVLPEHRRRGIGSALLRELVAHLTPLGYAYASAQVDGADEGSLAFARRYGFEEVNRQVEQVRTLGDEPAPHVPAGLRLVTVAERPELLRAAYDLAVEGYADMATPMPVTVSLEDWLAEEATLPEGSFVALDGDEIVGYAGLCRLDVEGTAENGLTVVQRAWRRRGVAHALKQAELHWAAASGLREIVTWTQRGNEGMRTLNERLGYVYRGFIVDVRAPLPLP